MEYFLRILFVLVVIGVFAAAIPATIYSYKLRAHRKNAPFLWRITGFSIYMSRYLTPEGIYYRNKAFLFTFVSVALLVAGLFIGIKMDPRGWDNVKDAYRHIPANMDK